MNIPFIIIGTRNKHKIREIKAIYLLLVPPRRDYSELSRRMSGNSFPDKSRKLSGLGRKNPKSSPDVHRGTNPKLNIRFIPLSDFSARGGNLPTVKENAKTYTENARKKAVSLAKYTGYITLSEDSGIEVKALKWQPGIYSARYASMEKNRNAPDQNNNQKLLNELPDVPMSKRIARYRCSAVVSSPNGKILAKAEGTCWGKIAFSPKGRNGFGYDPIFIPDKQPARTKRLTFGQLPANFKHTISHRGKALKKIFLKLSELRTNLF
ncbi:MAG: non-canonical purine NTP pyrophosphatase [Planctomycetota bacterium]|nr:non-canonical purine NTP pyrophosphatase [Planctomycetota bacterium]MDI6786832.1 non-canonical purine NTP pyrophosphatase [Planctomycetota bacterium]